MQSYRLSAAGRRTSIIVLVGALIIWAFALWSFRSTLGISYNPLAFFSSLGTAVSQGLGLSQIVPALLLLVLIVATPLVIWNVLEEWAASYTPTDDGLRFESLGIVLLLPWPAIVSIQREDADADVPQDQLLLAEDYTGQIGNPLLRFLHRQAYGRKRLPISGELERREELLDAIRARTGLPGAPASILAAE